MTVNPVLDFTEQALKVFMSLELDKTFTTGDAVAQILLEGGLRRNMSNKQWYYEVVFGIHGCLKGEGIL